MGFLHGRTFGLNTDTDSAETATAATEPEAAAEAETNPTPDGPDTPDTPAAPAAPAAKDRRRWRIWRGWRERYPSTARAVSWGTTGLAAVLVYFALLMPNQLPLLTPGRFIRIPAEAVLGAALLLVLPPRPRRVAAALGGVVIGLTAILNAVDMGYYSQLDRRFNPMLDWMLFSDAESFLKDSIGQVAAIAVAVVAVLLVLAVPTVMVLAVVRLSNVLVRHRVRANRGALVAGTAWIVCATLGLQIAGAPVASRSATSAVRSRVDQVNQTRRDDVVFAKQAAVDKFADTPSDQLLTGLRGKNVIFTFIESYGRSAIEDPVEAPGVDAALAAGTKQLNAAGFASKSGWLTSSTYGAGSWLGHSTFMSGLWINNQQRYNTITGSDRMSLTGAFAKTGAWRTVGIMPGVQRAWPEGKFYDLDKIYNAAQLGYQGPKFSWSTMPDQYTLEAYQRLEAGKKQDKPLMSMMILTSSHNPWAPLPRTIGWDQIGDGTVYNAIRQAGADPVKVWQHAKDVQAAYGQSIEYSVSNLIDYVTKYGDKNTVLVFLGDHQPNTTVSGTHASRDVPVTIVAHDPAVLKRIDSWNWTDGLQPAHNAPVWKMSSFRDRFLTAYGPQAGVS
jgi:hypothetical protein